MKIRKSSKQLIKELNSEDKKVRVQAQKEIVVCKNEKDATIIGCINGDGNWTYVRSKVETILPYSYRQYYKPKDPIAMLKVSKSVKGHSYSVKKLIETMDDSIGEFVMDNNEFNTVLQGAIKNNNLLEASVHLLLDQLLKSKKVISLKDVSSSTYYNWISISKDGIFCCPEDPFIIPISSLTIKIKLEILQGVKYKPKSKKK